ncbi:hypothetical protein JTB14_011463 [Gonioctena quinquepunctata]|nr:hypothetical protein JTB14_011463 [Gonioctena quinquepunctata]
MATPMGLTKILLHLLHSADPTIRSEDASIASNEEGPATPMDIDEKEEMEKNNSVPVDSASTNLVPIGQTIESSLKNDVSPEDGER